VLHYHFQSKAGLAQAVWRRIASEFVPGVLQMLSSELPLDEKIDRFVDAYHFMLTRHPYLLTYVLSEIARHPSLLQRVHSSESRRAARAMFGTLRRQIDEALESRGAPPVSAEQFFITLVGSCLFPFAARPMLSEVLGVGPREFQALMDRRRKELPAFLKRALFR
jgi:AcrR family transcriptional regulator